MNKRTLTVEKMQIFLTSGITLKKRTLFEEIFFEARRLGLSGVTIFKGFMGYGSENLIRGNRPFLAANDIPIVIDIIDTPEKLDLILPFLEEHLVKGLVVRTPANVVVFGRQIERYKKLIEGDNPLDDKTREHAKRVLEQLAEIED